MGGQRRTRFDVDALRELAGEQAFARGQAYQRDGLVEIFTINAERVVARVVGTEYYRTELTGRGKDMRGACSCPAFEDWGFCKHMVATALTANALGDDAVAEGANLQTRVREHLRQLGIDALVDVILGAAERDPVLFRQLEMAAALASADDNTLAARVRKVIDQVTDTGGTIRYRDVSDWAAEVEAALDPVAQLAEAGRGALALDLVERAIDRIEEAMETIDDSDGDGSALLQRCGEIHLAAARAAKPEPIAFARASEASHKREAVEVYTERVDQLANSGGNEAYLEAAGLVVRMGRLRSGAEQATYIGALKQRYGRKRNLTKLLGCSDAA